MDIAPAFRVVANDQDITDKLRERFKSLRLTDETGTTTDTVEITLADNDQDNPIQVPLTGAELQVYLGYDDQARYMGLFICDEIELSGFPGEMVIRARAAPYDKSTGGKSDMQSQKTRSWRRGTTVGAMVNRIAGEHGLKPAVSGLLASIALPHIDQAHESDMNLLSRLAKRFDAIAKPAGGALVFAKRGDAQSASGEALEKITLTPQKGDKYRVTLATRGTAGSCVAYYRDTTRAQRREVSIGGGEPVIRLRMAYPDRVSAENAARAEQRKRSRATRTMTYTFPGRPEVQAEATATMLGFRPGVDGDWLIKRVEHYVGPQGYRCTIDAELPNTDPEAAKVSATEANDTEQDVEDIE